MQFKLVFLALFVTSVAAFPTNTRASIKDARGGQWVRRDDKGTCSPPDGIEAPSIPNGKTGCSPSIGIDSSKAILACNNGEVTTSEECGTLHACSIDDDGPKCTFLGFRF